MPANCANLPNGKESDALPYSVLRGAANCLVHVSIRRAGPSTGHLVATQVAEGHLAVGTGQGFGIHTVFQSQTFMS